jgi:hypothetical protein
LCASSKVILSSKGRDDIRNMLKDTQNVGYL